MDTDQHLKNCREVGIGFEAGGCARDQFMNPIQAPDPFWIWRPPLGKTDTATTEGGSLRTGLCESVCFWDDEVGPLLGADFFG